ncbi:MAG: RluA family pseudouridine synthase, partial [Myxococcaceae bacterium]|nr:RluA family pseudouridine synthase [Myxococcaceae bacterium]
LDRDTSGVILVAKTRPCMVALTEMFTHGHPDKSYLALAKGRFDKPRGVIDLPLAEHEQSSRSKALRGVNMQVAITRYRVLAGVELASLLECKIETGRTHQIRRHLVAMGHPVAGDRRHGDFAFNRELKSRFGLRRMFLHARRLSLRHPITGERLTIEAPLPEELSRSLTALGIGLDAVGTTGDGRA